MTKKHTFTATIQNAGGGGAFVRASSLRTGQGDQPVIPQTNEFSGNTTGIATNTANLELGGGVVISGSKFDGVDLDQGTRMRANGIAITNNNGNGIRLTSASGVQLNGNGTNNIVTKNTLAGLQCIDAGSHYAGNTSGITDNTAGDVNCLPF